VTSTPTTPAKPLFRGNAHLVRQQLQTLDPQGKWVPISLVPAVVYLSLTPTGSPISGLGPFTADWNTAQDLVYTIPASVIDAGLSSIADNTVVYQVVEAGLSDEYRGVTPLRVSTPRFIS
jgi:hypothetical protein